MRQTGKSKNCVWRWQERFATEGAERVVALKLADPPGETTHWTADMMAKAAGISASAVGRIWKAHGLAPHRWRQFKLSNDPKFIDKLRDVVGLYVNLLAGLRRGEIDFLISALRSPSKTWNSASYLPAHWCCLQEGPSAIAAASNYPRGTRIFPGSWLKRHAHSQSF
ncbi:hypothetical protein RvVAR0630_pl04780 (plasmid) [Agrobacterium vitis]|nr:hypothetical protein RvVAR0630_pl04780 [Agrobacterium vitis]